MRRVLAIVAAVSVCVSARAVAQPTLRALLEQLRTADVADREVALYDLQKQPELLRTPAARRALIDLLGRENKWLFTRRPATHPSDDEKDENLGYAEYYSHLLDMVDSLIEPGDVKGVSLLVQSVYNADSDFAIKLASCGQTVVPALLTITAHRDPNRSSDCYEMLGQVLRQHRLGNSRYPLTPTSVRAVENRLRAGLRDPASAVRITSIFGVRVAGDVPSLPILEQIRTSDPYQAEPGHYILREAAARAILAIKEHPLTK